MFLFVSSASLAAQTNPVPILQTGSLAIINFSYNYYLSLRALSNGII